MKLKSSCLAAIHLLSCLTIFTTCGAHAEEGREITIDGSKSPDGRLVITIVPDLTAGYASGTCRIRETKTGKSAGSFEWDGFGNIAGSDAFKVIWRSDSRCFAISWEAARGHMSGAIYAPYKDGWMKLKAPDYMREAINFYNRHNDRGEKLSKENLSGKGCDVPRAWLSRDELRVEITDRIFSKPGGGDIECLFWATVRVVDSTIFSKPRVILEKVTFAPESAYRK